MKRKAILAFVGVVTLLTVLRLARGRT